jgi:hypothetical protein
VFYFKQFLAQKSITEMEHSSYSPHLAQNDFWLFPTIKSVLKGRRFQDNDMMTAMKAIPQQEFQKCFQQWQHHWAKHIADQGENFEGHPSQQAVSIHVCYKQTNKQINPETS